MHPETLARSEEVPCRPEGVRADEHALLRPPECRLVATDPQEDEWAQLPARDDVMRHTESPRDLGAVTVVTAEQLDNTGHVLQLPDSWIVDRVCEPRSRLGDERV
jgi:hypothetical protein